MTHTDNLVRFKSSDKHFNAVTVGDYRLSIQGSEGHYCTPRKTLPPYQYVSFEMMIFKEGSPNFNYRRSSVFRAFPRYKELLEANPHRNGVFGWLDKDIINDLITYLKGRV